MAFRTLSIGFDILNKQISFEDWHVQSSDKVWPFLFDEFDEAEEPRLIPKLLYLALDSLIMRQALQYQVDLFHLESLVFPH